MSARGAAIMTLLGVALIVFGGAVAAFLGYGITGYLVAATGAILSVIGLFLWADRRSVRIQH